MAVGRTDEGRDALGAAEEADLGRRGGHSHCRGGSRLDRAHAARKLPVVDQRAQQIRRLAGKAVVVGLVAVRSRYLQVAVAVDRKSTNKSRKSICKNRDREAR